MQNSVFECIVDATQFKQLQLTLAEIIDHKEDSLSYYLLGNNYKTKVEHVGAQRNY